MKITEFKKLGKAAKRVEIAKDVIAQIKAKKYRAKANEYITIPKSNKLKDEDNLQKKLPQIKSCSVCALGGLLMSSIKYENNLTYGDVYNNGWTRSFIENVNVNKLFNKLFTPKQLALIEGSFEEEANNSFTNYYSREDNKVILTPEEQKKCITFYKKFRSQENRLLGIMMNIIENSGTFKP